MSSSYYDFNHSLIVGQAVDQWKSQPARQTLALLYSLCFICEAVHSSGWLSPRRAPSLWPLADLYSTPTLPTSTSLFPSPLITTEGSICREAEFIPFVPPLFAFISWAGGSISRWIFIELPAQVSRRPPRPCSIRVGGRAGPSSSDPACFSSPFLCRKAPAPPPPSVRRERRDGPEKAASCRRINCSSSCL